MNGAQRKVRSGGWREQYQMRPKIPHSSTPGKKPPVDYHPIPDLQFTPPHPTRAHHIHTTVARVTLEQRYGLQTPFHLLRQQVRIIPK